MAFNYSLMRNLSYITTPSSSLYVNAASTASYVRQIIIYNPSASSQLCQLWLTPSGTTTPMTDDGKFFGSAISASSTFIIDFGIPGFIVSGTGAQLWGSPTTANGLSIMIVGGVE